MNSPYVVTKSASPIIPSFEYTRLADLDLYRQDAVTPGMSGVPTDPTWDALIGRLAALCQNATRRDLALAIFAIYAARVSEGLETAFPLGVAGTSASAYTFVPCSLALAAQDRLEDVLARIQDTCQNPPAYQYNDANADPEQDLSCIVTAGPVLDAYATAQIHLHCDEDGSVRLWHANDVQTEAANLILERMIALAQGIVAEPAKPLVHQPVMSARERALVLQDWNATVKPYRYDGGLVAMMAKAAAATPDHPALIYKDDTLSYAEFEGRVDRLARLLRAKGVGRDQFVCLCMDRSLEMVIAIWATLKAGGAYVPLNVEDPASRIAEIVADCRPKVLLTQETIRDRIETDATDVIVLPEGGDVGAQDVSHDPTPEIAGPDLAYMIYTSGSTGKPKGVVVEHAAIHNRVLWMHEEYGLSPQDRVLQKTPYTFDVSVWEFLWPLAVGSTLVIAEPGGHVAMGYLSDLIRDTGVTHLHFVPSVMRLFLMAPTLGELPIKKLFCSGEALGADLVRTFYDKANDTAEVHNLYGPTEAAVDVSYYACPRGAHAESVPIGRPVANTGLYVLDTYDQLVPVGVPGELHIGGIQLARGYWAREELTAQKFVPCPVDDAPHDRLYRTGDLAFFRPDGEIMYLGRNDFQVKINGVRIELGEVEAAIRAEHCVKDVVVVPEEQAGNKRLVAYVVSARPSTSEATRLQDAVAATCPSSYVPKEVRFIAEMPLTTSGKINRKALATLQRLGDND